MRIYIHAGMDKTGSTAIQAHLKLYRDFLLEKGILLPQTALTGLGHIELFKNLESPLWQDLRQELKGPEAAQAHAAFLSWEGIHFYSSSEIELLRQQLANYDVSLIIYIRNQLDIIQSGYLQQLKTRKQAVTLAGYQRSEWLLNPRTRDYHATFEKFAAVFGEDAVDMRIYDPERFPEKSIVYDILGAIGLPAETKVPLSATRQNISLDIPSAQILNIFDSVCDDVDARRHLVNELTFHIKHQGGGSSRFLDQAAVEKVEANFASSNRQLKELLGLPGEGGSLFRRRDAPESSVADPCPVLSSLARQVDAPLWDGKELSAMELGKIFGWGSGWKECTEEGVISFRTPCAVRFRAPIKIWLVEPGSLRLHFNGSYLGKARTSTLYSGGQCLGEFDMSACSIDVPKESLEQGRKLDLNIEHAQAEASGYRLESLSYTLR